eukprot:Skav233974  [mRNA]  locus=scaffold1008:644811:649248:+ [translate_table: standard]
MRPPGARMEPWLRFPVVAEEAHPGPTSTSWHPAAVEPGAWTSKAGEAGRPGRTGLHGVHLEEPLGEVQGTETRHVEPRRSGGPQVPHGNRHRRGCLQNMWGGQAITKPLPITATWNVLELVMECEGLRCRKLHFSPVRCCDLSLDERLLLTASDDKTLKLSSVPERRFLTSYLGHSNWVRAASLSASAQNIVSGGDDKTVRLWDVERKSSVQTFYDSASSITCTKFGMDDSILVASAWDSSINIWDVRSFQLRQHYGRAHGGLTMHPAA